MTDIIKQGVPSPQLMNWGVRVTAEYAVRQRAAWQALAASDEQAAIDMLRDVRWRVSGTASDRGTVLHRWANRLALGAPAEPPPEEAAPHAQQFERFLADWQPVYVAAEAPVYNLAYNYGGTLDAVVRLAGHQVLLDMKTTDREPGEARPPFNEVGLQLAAYSRAERMGLAPRQIEEDRKQRYYTWNTDDASAELPRIDGAVCLVVSPVDYAVHPIRIDDSVWHAFLHVREVARYVNEMGRTVVGAPVAPPPLATNEQQFLAEVDSAVAEGVLAPVPPAEDDGTFEALMAGHAPGGLQGGPVGGGST